MPLFDFFCPDGHKSEELFFVGETIKDKITCQTVLVRRKNGCVVDVKRCWYTATRREIYPVRTVGPVFEHLSAYNHMLLTPQERAAGVELTTAKQIAQREEAMGITRASGEQIRQGYEQDMDDASTMNKKGQEGGREAVANYIVDSEIQAETGWDHITLTKWKEDTAHAEQQLADAAVAGN